jgi:hypothetical protein
MRTSSDLSGLLATLDNLSTNLFNSNGPVSDFIILVSIKVFLASSRIFPISGIIHHPLS